MPSQSTMAPPASEIDPPVTSPATEAAAGPPTSTSLPRRSPPVRLARKMMAVLHGDKYMVGAYPPEWPPSSMRPDTAPRSDDTSPRR